MTAHLRSLALAVLICPALLLSAEPEKPVRLVWYPRFSPDNKLLATAHGDWDAKKGGEVRIWEAATGKPKHVLRQARGIRSVAFSSKSTWVAAGGYGRTIALFDANTGKRNREWPTPASVEVLQFHPQSLKIVAAHGDGCVRVWDLDTNKETAKLAGIHKGEIWGMMVSPDAKLVATAGQDGTVAITEMDSGKVRYRFDHQGANSVAFTSDSKQLAAGAGSGVISIYDVENGSELHQLRGHSGSTSDLQYSADDKVLVSAGFDKTIRVWDFSNPKSPELKKTLPAHDQLAFGVALSRDGKLLASAGWDDRINVWDAKTFEEKWTWDRAQESK